MKLELTIPSPLKDLFQHCATYCEPACCGLDAFDVDAYVIFRWFGGTAVQSGAEVLQQLDALIAQVAAHDGPVDSTDELKHDFGHEWPQSADCVTYLKTWRVELVRALSFGPDVLKSPESRLAEARLLGESEYFLTVRRMTADAAVFLHNGEEALALKVLSAIAPLDESDVTIASEVKYARKILTERGTRPESHGN
jgi:hypothetical protein